MPSTAGRISTFSSFGWLLGKGEATCSAALRSGYRTRPVLVHQQIGLDKLESAHVGVISERGAGPHRAHAGERTCRATAGVQQPDRAVLGDETGDPGNKDSVRRHRRCVSRGH